MSQNGNETINRLNKAEAVASVLRSAGAEAADLPGLPEAAWKLASREAGRIAGKDWDTCSAETRQVVEHLMRSREQDVQVAPDLFAGFPKF
jgi:hypothetical protein